MDSGSVVKKTEFARWMQYDVGWIFRSNVSFDQKLSGNSDKGTYGLMNQCKNALKHQCINVLMHQLTITIMHQCIDALIH